jgi:signal transduction histidine kinase
MNRSLFAKIFVTYLSILLCIMVSLAITITALADNYVYAERQRLLDNIGNKTNALAVAYHGGTIDADQLNEAINAMGFTTDTKIYIIRTGLAQLDQLDMGDKLSDPYLKQALERVLLGERVFQRGQYAAGFAEKVVFAAIPWEDETTIYGAILMFSPERAISSIIWSIRSFIIVAASVFVIIGGLVIYLFSKRLIMPIKAIEAASARMALGEDTPDIDIRSRDELGDLARSFNTMKNKIQSNEVLRQELFANISHDLRTPLTSINGFARGMADGIIKPKDYRKTVDIILSEVRRLMQLTDEILETAKIRSGNIELNLSRFSLRRAVDAAVAAQLALFSDKGMSICVNVDEGIALCADEKRIEQVLFNLLNNAFKYAYANTQVKVSAHAVGNEVAVAVENVGEGIDAKDLPHIFGRYYRATNAASGYGLGLSIVKAYVEAHGGRIEVTSTPNSITRFTIYISSL